MPTGKRQSVSVFRRPLFLKLYFLLGTAIIAGFSLWVVGRFTNEVKKEAEVVPRMFARYVRCAGRPNAEKLFYDYVWEEILPHVNYPLVLTDERGVPTAWKNIEVPEDKPLNELTSDEAGRLFSTLAGMRANDWYFPITYSGPAAEEYPPPPPPEPPRDKTAYYLIYAQSVLELEDQVLVDSLFEYQQTIKNNPDGKKLFVKEFRNSLLKKANFSLALTTRDYLPLYWKNLSVPDTKLTKAEKEQLHEWIQSMVSNHYQHGLAFNTDRADSIATPVAARPDSVQKLIGYAYYGESRAMYYLRMMPYMEMGVVAVFVLFGFWGIVFLNKHEKDLLWVGLAKETAHQFGTPITALLGWISLMRNKMEIDDHGTDYLPFLDYMELDVDRLNKVASRFGKVGSSIRMAPAELHEVCGQTVEYFRKRLPNLSHQINLEFVSEVPGIAVDMDSDLIQWALENLIKNAVDAMKNRAGSIVVSLRRVKKGLSIRVSDQGSGMPRNMQKKVFEPGVTTKQRGWGLGLSLTKRIVVEYHHGTIRIVESTPNVGTTVEIILPEGKHA